MSAVMELDIAARKAAGDDETPVEVVVDAGNQSCPRSPIFNPSQGEGYEE